MDIAMKFIRVYPEWKHMFKSFHAFLCWIGIKFRFERFTWENSPDGTEWRENPEYIGLHGHEIIESEINQNKAVTYTKDGMSGDGKKSISRACNISFEGYELIEIDSEYKSLSELILEKAEKEGHVWKVNNKYDNTHTTTLPEQVLTTLIKCDTVDHRNEWYLNKLREQWDEAVLINYCPELLARDKL